MKLKKLIWCFLYIVSTFGLYAQKYIAVDYGKSLTHYVIDNKVNVRSEPKLSGEKVFQLNAGDAVRNYRMG